MTEKELVAKAVDEVFKRLKETDPAFHLRALLGCMHPDPAVSGPWHERVARLTAVVLGLPPDAAKEW